MISACATIASFAIGLLIASKGFHSPLSWLPTGVAVALTLRWGRAQVPWIAVGATAIGLLGPHPPYALPAGVLALVSGPWVLAWWLERSGFHPDFARRGDVVRFVIATPLAMLLPPVITLGAMHAFGSADDALEAPFAHLLEWWMNGTISVMMLAPAGIVARADSAAAWHKASSSALLLAGATLGFCTLMLVTPTSLRSSWLAPVGVLIVVVSAMRMDLAFTGLLSLAMTTSVAMANEVGIYPASAPPSVATARVWAFSMVLAGLTLILRALLAERDALDQRLRDTETRYRQGLLEAAAREQERIGRDVHDSLGQELTAISLMARSLAARAHATSTDLGNDAQEIVGAARLAMDSARSIARGLLPTIDDGDDLVRALQALGERVAVAGGMQVTVRALPGLQIPAEQARNLYRIAQEALNNVLKHSRARRVELRLAPWSPQVSATAGNGLRMTIADDGVGIDEARAADCATTGIGQRTMQYRAAVAGGEMRFESAPGQGTRVICDLPLAGAAATAPRPSGLGEDSPVDHLPAARAAAALAAFAHDEIAGDLGPGSRAA